MSHKATLDRRALERFNRFWEDLYQVVPEARAQAVKAMGEAAQRELNAQIGKADLEADAKGTVRSWQELRFGSKGGYAALTPRRASPLCLGRKPKSWNGETVTVKQITKWLERGHGVRRPAPGSDRKWVRVGRSGLNKHTGVRYVKGRMFYSWTRLKAGELALKAADRVLSLLSDEVDY